MSEKDFENIRPYFDSEVAKITKGLAIAMDWVSMLSPLIGEDNAEEIAESMPHIETTAEFQDELTFPFLEKMVQWLRFQWWVNFLGQIYYCDLYSLS